MGIVSGPGLLFLSHSENAQAAESVVERTGSIPQGVAVYAYLYTPFGEASRLGHDFEQGLIWLRDDYMVQWERNHWNGRHGGAGSELLR